MKPRAYQNPWCYLRDALVTWCMTNRSSWSKGKSNYKIVEEDYLIFIIDDVINTAQTLWSGSAEWRDFYLPKKGKKKRYPLFRELDIPLYPWTRADATRAQEEQRLPLDPFPPDYVAKIGHPPLENNPLNQGHSINELSKSDKLKTDWLAAPGPIKLNADKWRGARCLGKGSDGITGLVVGVDESNIITQVSLSLKTL